jgi:hypothetical protein
MLEIKNAKVYDLEESVIACRNAMRLEMPEYTEEEFAKSLPRAIQLANTPNGSGHQNFLKGIRVSFDIKYPNYISPELQRYNWIDIVTSSSKMHRLLKMDLDKACNKYVTQQTVVLMRELINDYNQIANGNSEIGFLYLRGGKELEFSNKNDMLYHKWMQIISNCPQGIELFMRVSTNYLQIRTIVHQRYNHKLREDWGAFIDFARDLPYAREFIFGKLK